MFMPVMTVAMDNIAPTKIPRATALSNVIRQLAGAFSVAIFASLLLDYTRLHTTALAQVITPSSPPVLRLLSATKLGMEQLGYTADAAQRIGLLALGREVQVAATIRAFDDCFRIATFCAVIGIFPALLLTRKRKTAVGGGQREAVVEVG
jgi:DHA2 family multidrug resistance protein